MNIRPPLRTLTRSLALLISLGVLTAAGSADLSPEEQLFYSDDEETALAISDGQRVFMSPQHDEQVLHSDNTLVISQQSLEDGWVKLQQCYSNLDPVDVTAIGYNYRGIQGLKVISSRNIASTRVVGQTIELTDIRRDARLCIQARVNLLRAHDDSYSLRTGPYHRKFLDGYYPFHVTLTVRYPGDILELDSIDPEAQTGFNISTQLGHLKIDSWFQGRLTIEISFSKHDQ